MRISFLLVLLTSVIATVQSIDTTFIDTVDKVIRLELFDKIKENKLFKAVLISNPAFLVGFEVFNVVEDLIFPKDDSNKEFKVKLDELSKKLDEIYKSISALKDQIKISSKEIIINSKMTDFKNFILNVDGLESKMRVYQKTFNDTSSPILIELLTKLLNEKTSENAEYKIVKLFDISLGITESIIEDIITFSNLKKANRLMTLQSSTAKIIQDFYFVVLKYILKSFALRELAISIKYHHAPKNVNKSIEYSLIANTRLEVYKILKESLESNSARLTDDDFKAFISFNRTGNDKFVRFISMFQTFIVNEPDLTYSDSCMGTCQDYRKVNFHSQGCIGQVRDCWSDWIGAQSLNVMSSYLARQSPFKDRIYYAYKYGYRFFESDWYGIYGGRKDWWINNVYKQGVNAELFYCDVCVCICDQSRNPNTLRKFYVGKVEAPEGFVVTGVRFVEHKNSIALQIQTGKLLPTIVVDKKTLNWQNLPNNRAHIILTYDNPYKLGLTDNLKFEAKDTVVTGVQLIEDNRVIKLKIFGRSITNITTGTLSEKEVTVTAANFKDVVKPRYKIGVDKESNNFTIHTNARLEFLQSDKITDAGQNYVPYFDANEIKFQTASPISSVGLIHYTNNNDFSGYIRPTIKSIDFGIFAQNLQS